MTAPSFALLDAAGSPAVIHEDDANAQYTIRLTNGASSPLALVTGQQLSEEAVATATDSATRWYLSFPENYDESGASKLAIAADGWAVASYPIGSRTYLGFVPTANDTLAADGTVDFTVYGLVVKSSNALKALNLTVDWYVGSVPDAETLGMSAPVVSPEDNAFTATIDASTANLYLSDSKDYANTVRLNFQNGPTPLPQGGTVTLAVPIAPASGAVTTVEFATQITCAFAGDPSDSPWEITAQPSTGEMRSWILTPAGEGTQAALQPNETLVVEIGNVVTRVEGVSAVVVVSIQGFPSFPATIEQPLPLTLVTLPEPTISGYISRTPNSGAAGTQPYPYDSAISVTWTSEFATAVSIAYDDSITTTSYAQGVPLSGAQTLPSTTVDALVTLVATNDRFSSTAALPIAVQPTELTLTVTSTIAAWDFRTPTSQASRAPGPPTIAYTIAAAPARLLTGLAATTPAGTTALAAGATSFAFTQTAASGQLAIVATFGGGIGADQKPTTVTLTTGAPAIAPLPTYLIGTSWSDKWQTFTFADAQTISMPAAVYPPYQFPYIEDGNIIYTPQESALFFIYWMWTPPRITNYPDGNEGSYAQNNPPPLPSSTTTVTPSGALPRLRADAVEEPPPFDPPKPWVLGTIMADLASRFGVTLPWLNGTLALDTVSLTAEGTQSGTCTLGGALALGTSSRFDATVSFASGDGGKKTFSIDGTITIEDVAFGISAAQGDAVDVSLTSSAGITLARIAGWFGLDLSAGIGPAVHTIAIHHDLSGKGNGFTATSDRITATAASDGTNRLVTIDVALGLTFVHSGLTVPGVAIDVDFGAKSVQLAIASAALDDDAVKALGTLLPPTCSFAVAELPLAAGATLAVSLVIGPKTNVYALPLSEKDNENGTNRNLAAGGEASTSATLGVRVDASIGPIHVERLTIGYSDGAVTLGIEGGFALDGLTLDFEGLEIGGTFGDDGIDVDLSGLALSLQGDAFTIAGEFLIEKNAAYDGGRAYSGGAILAAEKLSIGAAGSWGTLNGEPSMFVWGEFDEPLGGPPFCFVRGVSAAFGLNRSLIVPPVQNLATFPLVQAAMADANHPNPLAGLAPVDVLQSLESAIQPAYGAKWAAAGLRFTSFGVVEGFALLVIQFGTSITFQLLGVGAASLPKGAENPLAYVELPVEVTVDPAHGSVLALARLAPSSYVLDPDCRLQGGFAFGAWFEDDATTGARAGDFVYTLGGYHPAFAPPSYYPSVPRLSAHWARGDLTIDGTYYFALTSAALMAGGSLQAVWESGPVRAWFDADADFLIAWRPFAYDARVGITIGASFTIDLLITSVEMTIHVGVDIHFWGPPFQGEARVDLDVISFTVSFGADTDTSEKKPISWDDFKTGFFPPSTNAAPAAASVHALAFRALGATATTDVSICRARVTKGLLKTIDPAPGSTAAVTWVVDGATFELTTETAIPAKAAYLATGETDPPVSTRIDGTWNATGFDVGPVGVTNADLLSDHTVSLRGIAPAPLDPTPDLIVTPVTGSVAGTAWSVALAQSPSTSTINSNVAPIANALTGIRLAPRRGPSETGLPQPLALARLEFANDPHILQWSRTLPRLPASTAHPQGQAATDRVTATVDDLAYVARRNALAVAAHAAGFGVVPGGRLSRMAATFTNTAPPLLRTLGET